MTVETTTQTVESIVNAVAPVVGAVISSVAPQTASNITTAEGALSAAETVADAVEANTPHNTAISDIAVGVKALASTPVVQSNPVAAAHAGALAALLADIAAFFKSL